MTHIVVFKAYTLRLIVLFEEVWEIYEAPLITEFAVMLTVGLPPR